MIRTDFPPAPGYGVALADTLDLKTAQTVDIRGPRASRLLLTSIALVTRAVAGLSDGATVKIEEFDPNKQVAAVAASLTTAISGANNDLVFTAKAAGTGGNAITVAYVAPGTNDAALGVEVTGSAIVVNLATDGSAAVTSTAAQVKAAIEAAAPADALVSVANAAANDGTGVVAALTATPLAGGAAAYFGTVTQTLVEAVAIPDTSAVGQVHALTLADGVKAVSPDTLIRVTVTAGSTATTHVADLALAGLTL